jgi:hypothetical protein
VTLNYDISDPAPGSLANQVTLGLIVKSERERESARTDVYVMILGPALANQVTVGLIINSLFNFAVGKIGHWRRLDGCHGVCDVGGMLRPHSVNGGTPISCRLPCNDCLVPRVLQALIPCL